jgi:hypothetical protein
MFPVFLRRRAHAVPWRSFCGLIIVIFLSRQALVFCKNKESKRTGWSRGVSENLCCQGAADPDSRHEVHFFRSQYCIQYILFFCYDYQPRGRTYRNSKIYKEIITRWYIDTMKSGDIKYRRSLLDSAPNLGPLISRWEITNKFENCWYKSVGILKALTTLFQQFLNLSSSQREMSDPILRDLSNNRRSGGRRWIDLTQKEKIHRMRFFWSGSSLNWIYP